MDVRVLATAFNEWMRRYIEEPARFAREIDCVREFLLETERGEVPSYGEECAVYITHLMAGRVSGGVGKRRVDEVVEVLRCAEINCENGKLVGLVMFDVIKMQVQVAIKRLGAEPVADFLTRTGEGMETHKSARAEILKRFPGARVMRGMFGLFVLNEEGARLGEGRAYYEEEAWLSAVEGLDGADAAVQP